MAKTVRFKYKDVDEEGQSEHALRRRGQLAEHELILDEKAIPLTHVLRAIRRPRRIVLEIEGELGPFSRGLAVSGVDRRWFLHTLNALASARRAEDHFERLKQDGARSSFRAEACPACGATVDLTDWPRTPQMYCRYCDTVSTMDGHSPARETKYHLCPNCLLYGRPKAYTCFYLVGPFISLGDRYDCTRCMRRKAWLMLFGNLLCLLGVPVGIWQFLRAYLGRPGDFAGLDHANGLALRGKTDRAVEQYDLIEQRLHHCAGVRYSHALALIAAGRASEAAEQGGKALADCGNYEPVYPLLDECYQALGRHDQLAALQAQWRQGSCRAPYWRPERLPYIRGGGEWFFVIPG